MLNDIHLQGNFTTASPLHFNINVPPCEWFEVQHVAFGCFQRLSCLTLLCVRSCPSYVFLCFILLSHAFVCFYYLSCAFLSLLRHFSIHVSRHAIHHAGLKEKAPLPRRSQGFEPDGQFNLGLSCGFGLVVWVFLIALCFDQRKPQKKLINLENNGKNKQTHSDDL